MEQTKQIKALSSERLAGERNHLYRVLTWGAVNAMGGGALWAVEDAGSVRSSFGQQSSLWGLVNVGIASVGLLTPDGEPTTDLTEALHAERRYHDILLANLGLNVGYMGVGAAMIIAAGEGVSRGDAWRGHGGALVLQGLGLFALDAISWAASRSRLSGLVSMIGDASASAAPGGIGVAVRF